jgi:filamentous hemagglutinin
MGHQIDAVSWWNSNGRFTGAQSNQVLTFMTDPLNYEFEKSSENQERGRNVGARYLEPTV